jgi:hypothetical protein
MASIFLEIGNKYTDEREKQFYLQGEIKMTYGIYKLYSIYVQDMSIDTVSFFKTGHRVLHANFSTPC